MINPPLKVSQNSFDESLNEEIYDIYLSEGLRSKLALSSIHDTLILCLKNEQEMRI